MVSTDISERPKRKPRGRPFVKGNVNGKPRDSILDASGRESGVRGDVIAPAPQKPDREPLNHEIKQIKSVAPALKENNQSSLKENMETKETATEILNQAHDETKEEAQGEESEFTLVDSLTFSDGPNVLKITLKKKKNRMFRMQIFLNETQEVRPLTYNGSATALTFWNLLKGSLKK